MGFFDKIKAGLTRTKENIASIGHSFDQLFAGELDDDFYDELEEALAGRACGRSSRSFWRWATPG